MMSRTLKNNGLLRQRGKKFEDSHEFRPKLSSSANNATNQQEWQSDMDKALFARLHHLEAQNEKQKDTIRQLRQENVKLKSDEYKRSITKQELKNSGYGGPWSDAQLEFILNHPLRNGRMRKEQLVKWSAEDIMKGIILFQKLLVQGNKKWDFDYGAL